MIISRIIQRVIRINVTIIYSNYFFKCFICVNFNKPDSVLNSHSSRIFITKNLKLPTRVKDVEDTCTKYNHYSWYCYWRGLPIERIATPIVSSYLTFSPLPNKFGGNFLWHFPSNLDYSKHEWLLATVILPSSPDFPPIFIPKKK